MDQQFKQFRNIYLLNNLRKRKRIVKPLISGHWTKDLSKDKIMDGLGAAVTENGVCFYT